MNFYAPSKHPQEHPQEHLRVISLPLLATLALVAAIATPAFASLSCVNPGGKAGCFSTLGAAVAAASPGGTIKVRDAQPSADRVGPLCPSSGPIPLDSSGNPYPGSRS